MSLVSVLREFEASWLKFNREIEAAQARAAEEGKHTSDWYASIWASREWLPLAWYGEGIVDHILKEKFIPKGKAKALEMVARLLVYGPNRVPRKLATWATKSAPRIRFLIDAAKTWADLGDNSQEAVFQEGPFRVIDTVQLDEKRLRATKQNIKDVVALVRRSGVPNAEQVLRGDIVLVGKIRGNAGAWYKRDADELHIRPLIKKMTDKQKQFALHELGHRYWDHNLPPALQMEWRRHHTTLQWEPTPKVEIAPGTVFKNTYIRGIKGDPVIDHTDDRYVYFVGSDVKLDRMKAWKALNKQAQRDLYPTPYSTKNPEEHFCESFAMYILGTLPANHRATFDDIVVGGVKKTAMISNPMIWFKNYPQCPAMKSAAYDPYEDEYDDVGFGDEGFWGNSASGILYTTGEKMLLLERSARVEDPHVWGVPGGAIPENYRGEPMDAYRSALNESSEEMGTSPRGRVVGKYVFRSGSFTFTTFIVQIDAEFTNIRLNWENDAWDWYGQDDLAGIDLHPGVAEVLRSKGRIVFDSRAQRVAQRFLQEASHEF